MIDPVIIPDTKFTHTDGRQYARYTCGCSKEFLTRTDHIKTGLVKSCGCWQKQSRYKDPGTASFQGYFTVYKEAARVRKHIFSLSFYDFQILVTENCHYCGTPPKPYNKYTSRKGKLRTVYGRPQTTQETADRGWINVNGIDRKDNKVGYILPNCLPCCTICNHAKHNLSYEEFLEYLERVRKFQNAKIS